MKYSQPHVPPSASSIGGDVGKVKHRVDSSARGSRGVDAFAYTSSPTPMQAHAVSLSSQGVQARDYVETFIPERHRLIVVAIITSLYALLLGFMLYMST